MCQNKAIDNPAILHTIDKATNCLEKNCPKATIPFKLGDVVQLKSGGPPMSVDFIGERIVCCWFDLTNVCQQKTFPPEVLVLVLVRPQILPSQQCPSL